MNNYTSWQKLETRIRLMGKKSKPKESSNFFNDPLVVTVAVVLALLPIVMYPYIVDIYALPKVTFLYISTMLLILLYLIRSIKARKFVLYRSVLDIPIILILLTATISLLFSNMPILGLVGKYQRYETLPALFCYAAIFFLITQSVRDEKSFEQMLKVLAIGFIPIAAYGLLQASGLDFPNIIRFGSRVHSSLGNPVLFGTYLVIMLPLLLSLARGSQEERWRMLAWLLILVGGINLIFTESRGAWLGLTAAALAIFIRWRKNAAVKKRLKVIRPKAAQPQSKNRTLVVTIILIIAVLLATSILFVPNNHLKKQLTSTFTLTDGSAAARIETWKTSLKMIKSRPLTGYGLEQMGYWSPIYKTARQVAIEPDSAPDQAHNDLLQMAVDAGIPGMLLYIWMFTVAILGLFKSRTVFRSSYLTGLFGAIIGYLAQAQTGIPSVFTTPLIWSLLGVAANLRYPIKPVTVTIPHWFKLKFAVSVLAIAFAWLAVFALNPVIADYYIYKGNALFKAAPDQAAPEFNAAVGLFPYQIQYERDAIEFYLNYASIYQSSIFTRQAFLLALQGLSYNKRSFELTYYAGEANFLEYKMSEDKDVLAKAKSYYKRAENLWPSLTLIKRRLLDVAEAEGNSKAAYKIAEELIKMGDKDPSVYYMVAMRAQSSGNHKKAEQYFKKINEIDPSFMMRTRSN